MNVNGGLNEYKTVSTTNIFDCANCIDGWKQIVGEFTLVDDTPGIDPESWTVLARDGYVNEGAEFEWADISIKHKVPQEEGAPPTFETEEEAQSALVATYAANPSSERYWKNIIPEDFQLND